jgi:hypothetical protein
MIQRAAAAGEALLRDFGLHLLIIANSAVGRATDGCHMLGFGRDLGSQVTPMVEAGLLRTLQHFLDGGAKGRFASVRKTSLPLLDKPAQAVLFDNRIVQLEGLFLCRAPEALVYAPSYKLKDRYFTRGLTMSKRLRLHQLLLAIDPLLAGLNPGTPCPFEDSPSPEIYTSVFHQLWGTCVGGVHSIGRLEVGVHGIGRLEVKEEVNEGEEMVEEVKIEEAMVVGKMEEVKKEEVEEMVKEVKKEEAMVVGRIEEVKKE